jgi:hypothetical protein
MAESWDLGGSMNYLYHMKVVFDLLLNSRDRNKDANELAKRHWRGLSFKNRARKCSS